METIDPFTPNREEKRRKAENTNKPSGSEEVVLLEGGMTDPMHPLHDEARKAVQQADDAYGGSPEEIDNLVTQAAQTDLQEDLVVFGEASEKAEKAGLTKNTLSPETGEKGETWDDSPFSPVLPSNVYPDR